MGLFLYDVRLVKVQLRFSKKVGINPDKLRDRKEQYE